MDTNLHRLAGYCESLPGSELTFPFGPESHCYKVGGRIFAMLVYSGIPGALSLLLEDESIPREQVEPMATFRCTPETGDFYRRQFPGKVLRGYHSPPAQQPYSITVLAERVTPDLLLTLARHSYDAVLAKLPARRRAMMTAEEPDGGHRQ